jgi:hypothetical protein
VSNHHAKEGFHRGIVRVVLPENGFGDGTKIRLSFQIAKVAGLHLLESPLSIDQRVEEVSGRFRIMATVVDTPQLDRWLLGFGSQVKLFRK